ncbi:hypothetical protein [Luteipulveratus mongoliensis]|uniref:DUF559 domain-containing protein n=1 Tax=Luteipulveratus mongoliensis TaxID=571913 RepID=A0A0K1JG95_9MICO|nr:hypothetical protein [Luteipulveratus mongoliensis]AKU15716.1 hypothetical protein VV02_07380 [Luteipulveratus mongoliensis]
MIDPALVQLAAEQSMLFRRADAEQLGVTDFDLRQMVRSRLCRPVIRSVYSVMPKPALPSERLVEKTLAMLLANPHVAAAGRSALALLDVDLFGVNYEKAQGIWLNKCATRSTTDLVIRRPLVMPAVSDVDGHLVVTAPWAIVDVARDAGVVAGTVSADNALHHKRVTVEELEDVIRAQRGASRISRATRAVELSDRRSESVGETRLRLLLQSAGIDVEPQFKVTVGKRVLARADFRVKGTRLLIEFDGMVKYRGDEGADVLAREKRREDVVRPHGWTFERVVHTDFDQPRVLIARLRSAADNAPDG